MWDKIKSWAIAHPWMFGGIIFAVGVLIIYWMRSGTSTVAGDNGLSAYYNAQAAAAVSGNDLLAAQQQMQIQAAGINAQVNENATNAATQLAVVNSNNNAAVTLGTAQITEQGHAVDVSAQVAELQSTLSAQIAAGQNSTQQYVAQLGANVQNNLIQAQSQATGELLNANIDQQILSNYQNIQLIHEVLTGGNAFYPFPPGTPSTWYGVLGGLPYQGPGSVVTPSPPTYVQPGGGNAVPDLAIPGPPPPSVPGNVVGGATNG